MHSLTHLLMVMKERVSRIIVTTVRYNPLLL